MVTLVVAQQQVTGMATGLGTPSMESTIRHPLKRIYGVGQLAIRVMV